MEKEFIVDFKSTNSKLLVEFSNLIVKEDTLNLQEKTIEPLTQEVRVEPDSSYQGLSLVVVNAIQTEELTITASGTYLPSNNKFYSKVIANVQSGGEQPTLYTPTLEIDVNDILTIRDGNGLFPTYSIRVQGDTTYFTFETSDKVINLKDIEGLTHLETQEVYVTAKGTNFNDSEVATITWIFVEATQGMTYTLNEDGQSYTLTGRGEATTTDIIIPATYNGLPVTQIGTQAFYDTDITSVVMGDNIQIINASAFYRCDQLTSALFKEGLLSIETNAFSYTALVNLVLPASLQTIKANCFSYVNTFEEVIFKGTPVSIDRQTFAYDRYAFSMKVAWSEGAVANATWGATQVIMTYDYTGD